MFEFAGMRRLLLMLAAASFPALADETDDAMAVYNRCVVDSIKRVSVLCEPAETLAAAAVGRCNSELKQFTVTLIDDLGLETAESLARDAKQSRTEFALSVIIETRLQNPC